MDCGSRAFLGFSKCGSTTVENPYPRRGLLRVRGPVNLKLPNSFHGSSSRQHDLAKLFKQLPAPEEHDIRKRTNWPDASFLQELGRIANAFADWRYVYESPQRTSNFLFLKNFSTAVQQRALEARPATCPLVANVTLKGPVEHPYMCSDPDDAAATRLDARWLRLAGTCRGAACSNC
jgi:hypothetical protein